MCATEQLASWVLRYVACIHSGKQLTYAVSLVQISAQLNSSTYIYVRSSMYASNEQLSTSYNIPAMEKAVPAVVLASPAIPRS